MQDAKDQSAWWHFGSKQQMDLKSCASQQADLRPVWFCTLREGERDHRGDRGVLIARGGGVADRFWCANRRCFY